VVFQNDPIYIANLISDAVRPLLIPMELHNINLQINAPKELMIQGDFGWLSEAIQNILKNCMESAGENGKIEIDCTDTLLFTEIAIHDSGPGIENKDIQRLFDRFYRGKSTNSSGYGIGLALSKMIITGQGGTIAVKNHPQGGAIFAIRFPK
jgi:hypothetical protein